MSQTSRNHCGAIMRSVGKARNLPISRVSPSLMSSSNPRATISESCNTLIVCLDWFVIIAIKKHPVKGAAAIYEVVS